MVPWWSHVEGEPPQALEVRIGLREASMCRPAEADGECAAVALTRLTSAAGYGWVRAGLGAYAGAWMAAMLGLALAGVTAAGRRAPGLTRTALVAALGALAAGGCFIAWAPPELARGPSYGPWLYAAGGILLAVAAALALRRPAALAEPTA